jgi:hypothetical protein
MDNLNTEKFYMKYEYYGSNAYFMKHRRTLKQDMRVSMNYSTCPCGEYSLRLLKATYAVPTCSSNSTEWTSVTCIKRVPPLNLQMWLQRTVCIFFTAFTIVGTHSCITRIWRTPSHHNKGRVFSFTAQLRQLRVRGEPCHAAAALSRSLGVLNICPHFGKLSLQPNISF